MGFGWSTGWIRGRLPVCAPNLSLDQVVRPSKPILVAVAFGLFLVWSNSFVAMSYLLGTERGAAQLDWKELTVARFLMAAPVCAVFCLRQYRQSWKLMREHPIRLAIVSALAVPTYNLALYYGQQHGVPAPIASLTTALLPLFVIIMSAAFLGERLTFRRLAGFSISVAGMALIALSGRGGDQAAYGKLIAIVAVAPLSWSVFSILSKPIADRVSMLLWTFLAISIGTLMTLPLWPSTVGSLSSLTIGGWTAVAYLAFPCTVAGFALWTWLLRYLPASTVGLTVFLNPPLTTLSKLALSALLPGVFLFAINPLEMVGGAVAMLGLFVSIGLGRRKSRR